MMLKRAVSSSAPFSGLSSHLQVQFSCVLRPPWSDPRQVPLGRSMKRRSANVRFSVGQEQVYGVVLVVAGARDSLQL